MTAVSLAERLAADGCVAMLVVAESGRDPDVAPFAGAAHLGACFVVATGSAPPALGFLTPMERDEAATTGCRLLTPAALEIEGIRRRHPTAGARWAETIARAFDIVGVEKGRVALAGRIAAGAMVGAGAELERRGWELADGGRLSLLLRRRKGEAERRAARHAAAGTAAAFRRVAAILAASEVDGATLRFAGKILTVGRLRRAIAAELARFGLEQPQGNIVAPGAAGGVPHSVGMDEDAIVPGRTLVVDLFPRGHLFADCSRTFCVGEPSAAAAAAHRLVRRALAAAQAALAPGVRGWDLQATVCEVLEGAGHPTSRSHPGTAEGYVHGLGHGVGFEVHEYPSFRREAEEEGTIEIGDLLTLEPGLYYPRHPEGGFGVRLEDFVLMSEEGAENLTPLPYDLDPAAWPELPVAPEPAS